MNQRYIITDPRPLECFKDKTFSDFKKLDVYKALYILYGLTSSKNCIMPLIILNGLSSSSSSSLP